jgi:hypothetical protein
MLLEKMKLRGLVECGSVAPVSIIRRSNVLSQRRALAGWTSPKSADCAAMTPESAGQGGVRRLRPQSRDRGRDALRCDPTGPPTIAQAGPKKIRDQSVGVRCGQSMGLQVTPKPMTDPGNRIRAKKKPGDRDVTMLALEPSKQNLSPDPGGPTQSRFLHHALQRRHEIRGCGDVPTGVDRQGFATATRAPFGGCGKKRAKSSCMGRV